MTRFAGLGAVLLACCPTLPSFGGDGHQQNEAPGVPKSSNLPAAAPAWSLPSASSGLLNSTNYAGKVILLNFFDTTCDACMLEVPNLVQIQTNYAAAGLQVVGVAMDPAAGTNSPVSAVAAFASNMGIMYPLGMAYPSEGAVAANYGAIAFPNYAYGMEFIPTTFVINRQNQIVQTFVNGAQTYDAFEAAVKPLLALSATPALLVSVSNGQLTLSWLATPTLFNLKTKADLSQGLWTPLSTPSPQFDGTNNFVTLPLPSANQFFQLSSP
jgi:peroxiredoxin